MNKWILTLIFFIAFRVTGEPRPATVGDSVRHIVNVMARDDPSGVLWRAPPLGHEGANALLLTVEELELPVGAKLIVRWNGQEVQLLGNKHHEIAMMGTSQALLEVRGQAGGQAIRLVYQIAFALPRGRPFSFKNPPRFEDISNINVPAIQLAARSVAALFWPENGQWKVCTGFMVSDRYLLTNHHCISRPEQCESLQVIFDYKLFDGAVQPGSLYRCKGLIDLPAMKEFDLALVELLIPTTAPPLVGLKLSIIEPKINQPITILQYPQGVPMKVVRLGCDVKKWPVMSPTANRNVDLAHQCDTAEGSSGSPVLSASGQVIAIHHIGYGGLGFEDMNRAIGVSPELRGLITSMLLGK